MHIQPVQNNLYNYKTLNFKHWNRTVYKLGTNTGFENVVLRNNTGFYRDPDFWLDLAEFLEKKLKNIPKMNIYSYGCSDGSDPLSLVMTLLAHNRNSVLEKFSPIIAKDIDSLAIARAKAGLYEIVAPEKETIDRYTCGKFNNFFREYNGKSQLVPEANFEINPEAIRHIKYHEANVLDDYKTIEPNNSIVLLRNMLPYLTPNYGEGYYRGGDWSVQKKFLNDLYNHLGENSYIAVGGYDRHEMRRELEKALRKAGFEPTNIFNLYRRVPENEKNILPSFIEKALEFFKNIFY